MVDTRVTRRGFVKTSVAAATVASVGWPATSSFAMDTVSDEVKQTRSFNPQMEYRRLGKTGLWVSAVCLGGHWKRIDKIIGANHEIDPYEGPGDADDMAPFMKNRAEVVDRCIESGINCIDFAGNAEPETYCRVLHGRRDAMYLCYSHPASELREEGNRTTARLVELFEAGLKRCRLEYADVWRLMAHERGSLHTQPEVDAMIEALRIAKQKGLCRYTGFSTHDAKWAKKLIETYADELEVLCMPYTIISTQAPSNSLLDTLKQHDVGVLGIKPFFGTSLFAGNGSPSCAEAEADDRRARLAIRKILNNPAITAPIPGLASTQQVDNVVTAVREPRVLNEDEQAEVDQLSLDIRRHLPPDYQWLKEWEYV